MWKHSLKSRTEKYNDYGTRNRKQRNARNETTHFGHSGSKQMYSGDSPNAPSALRGEKSASRDGRSTNGSSSVLALCRTIGKKALFPTPKLQARYFTDSPTSTDYCKKTIAPAVSKGNRIIFNQRIFLVDPIDRDSTIVIINVGGNDSFSNQS